MNAAAEHEFTAFTIDAPAGEGARRRLCGRGGMGWVYDAEHEGIGRRVAHARVLDAPAGSPCLAMVLAPGRRGPVPLDDHRVPPHAARVRLAQQPATETPR